MIATHGKTGDARMKTIPARSKTVDDGMKMIQTEMKRGRYRLEDSRGRSQRNRDRAGGRCGLSKAFTNRGQDDRDRCKKGRDRLETMAATDVDAAARCEDGRGGHETWLDSSQRGSIRTNHALMRVRRLSAGVRGVATGANARLTRSGRHSHRCECGHAHEQCVRKRGWRGRRRSGDWRRHRERGRVEGRR